MVERQLLFFDFEVTPNLWMVTFIEYKTKKVLTIINDREKLMKFYNLAKECIFISYNGRTYDIPIFKSILLGLNPYRVSIQLIEQGKKSYQILPKEQKQIKFYHYDTSTGFHSLKQLEGFLGMNIEESSVSFSKDILTDDDVASLKKYNIHDVMATIEVFEKRKDEFNAYMTLIEMFDLPAEYLNKTKAQLGAIILDAKKPTIDRDDCWDLRVPDNLELGRYEFVKDWFFSDEAKEPNAKLKMVAYGVEGIIAWGGAHFAKKNITRNGFMVNFDISSMYPQTMIAHDTLSRNIKDKNKFVEIRDLRLEYKRTHKDELSYSLKILINSIFGASGDKYNDLYDERNKRLTCMYGQLFILDLLDKLETHFGDSIECIQINTDAVMFKLENNQQYLEFKEIISEWEKRSKYEMEGDEISYYCAKDVNNYVMKITKNGEFVKIKAKGSMVKKNTPLDNDLPIVNTAIRNFLCEGIPVEKTINNCDDYMQFQKIYKITSNYNYAIHNGEPLPNKVNRIFASKNKSDTAIFKLKKGKEKPDLFAGSPDHCFIDNSDIRNTSVPDNLDKQWYIACAVKRVEMFTKEKYIRKED